MEIFFIILVDKPIPLTDLMYCLLSSIFDNFCSYSEIITPIFLKESSLYYHLYK